jgi:hypothetical protein
MLRHAYYKSYLPLVLELDQNDGAEIAPTEKAKYLKVQHADFM